MMYFSAHYIFRLLALLVAAHCLADYPLQGEFLSKAKNRYAPLPGVPWYQALGAHAIIHGGFVGLITGSGFLGFMEALTHFVIDDMKCTKKIGFNEDQLLHLFCKILWVVALAVHGDAR